MIRMNFIYFHCLKATLLLVLNDFDHFFLSFVDDTDLYELVKAFSDKDQLGEIEKLKKMREEQEKQSCKCQKVKCESVWNDDDDDDDFFKKKKKKKKKKKNLVTENVYDAFLEKMEEEVSSDSSVSGFKFSFLLSGFFFFFFFFFFFEKKNKKK